MSNEIALYKLYNKVAELIDLARKKAATAVNLTMVHTYFEIGKMIVEEEQQGKVIKINGFPAEHKVKLFRVVLSTQRTDYVVTNEMAQDNVEVVHDLYGFRWKVEKFHRETKQLTGLEENQCRKARIVRNHMGVPFWFGFVSNKWRLKRNGSFIASNMTFWMNICANNSSHPTLKCFLRKSYLWSKHAGISRFWYNIDTDYSD